MSETNMRGEIVGPIDWHLNLMRERGDHLATCRYCSKLLRQVNIAKEGICTACKNKLLWVPLRKVIRKDKAPALFPLDAGQVIVRWAIAEEGTKYPVSDADFKKAIRLLVRAVISKTNPQVFLTEKGRHYLQTHRPSGSGKVPTTVPALPSGVQSPKPL